MWQGGRCHGKQHSGTTSTRDASPRHLPRQKPYHKHPRSHHRAICQDKNLTTSTREPSPRHLPRQKPYHKHPRNFRHGICQDKNLTPSTRDGICQDKNLTTSTRRAFTTAFAKTKTLPQARAQRSPRHLPRQKPYHKHPPSPRHSPRQKPCHKHPRSLHQGTCQNNSLTTNTRGAFTLAFAKTKTLP